MLCIRCDNDKDKRDFYNNPKKPGEKLKHCKLCHGVGTRKSARDWYARNRRQEIKRVAQYRKDNPMLVREIEARRRASKNVSVEDRAIIRAYSEILINDPCSFCGGEATAIDHIDPLAKGGLHAWENLTAICKSCNSSKNSKLLLLWMVGA